MYAKFLSTWGKRKLSAIRKIDIATLLHRVAADSGPYQANRVHELIRAMFNRARGVLGYQGENPAVGWKRFKENTRDRFLRADELRAFFDALAAEANVMIQHFFLLALLTGARRSSLQAMRWADIDFTTALWRIPETKSGTPMTIPLTAAALVVLQARHEADAGSEWVFPSHSRTGHMVEPKSAWKRIIRRAGLIDVRPYDLRRSLGSWMAMSGASLPIVGKMLGHQTHVATMIYSRLDVDPVRRAAETATAAMLAAGGVKLIGMEASQENPDGGEPEQPDD